MAAFSTLGPREADRAMARMSGGNARKMSVTRMVSWSHWPPT